MLHEEAGEGTVRVVFEPDFNLIVRQYDASFELVLDRDMVLTYQGSNTVSTDALTEQEIEDETKILQIITQMDLSLDQKEFYRSLREMNAEYIVLSISGSILCGNSGVHPGKRSRRAYHFPRGRKVRRRTCF